MHLPVALTILASSFLITRVCAHLIAWRETRKEGPIRDAIESGAAAEYNKSDCVWRHDNDVCPDPDVHVYLYSPGHPRGRLLDPLKQSHWLRKDYDPTKDSAIVIHGYAGPSTIIALKDAYLKNGSYNVFLVDWGALSARPCYAAAAWNIRPVAKCLAGTLTTLRHLGLPIARTTCVGHSMGAHICGVMTDYFSFRMHRIIGLDPARVLVRLGLVNRLNTGDADFVEVMHTNAGGHGEVGRVGDVDFFMNGGTMQPGTMQPFCANQTMYPQTCSHLYAVCYMAQSVDNGGRSLIAKSCFRRSPSGPRTAIRAGKYVTIGEDTPINVRGSFCFSNPVPPYCPKYWNGHGNKRCCIPEILEKVPPK
ncbi:phospholipase A1 member A-like [Temnothorax curvispinosus]|uniref:phospholipase A1 n=1 Tax=Temnothorax curvispinosus TaxID=300111 RepID=A0A6J1RMC7_9HYME|nr:phospholipase A1 member A-like [Temnothorax curvispinosus]